ncbi:MAG: hypothetical protein PUB52_10900 [Lachnospiraceae bacterium]|nr:hypothetical protein [Lachnospiraceae bacterium]
MFKKMVMALLVGCVTLGFAACGRENTEVEESQEEAVISQETQQNQEEAVISEGAQQNQEELFFLDYESEHEGEVIPCRYADEDYFIFSAGTFEGSMHNFFGKFYVYDRNAQSYVAEETLTDSPTFAVYDGKIYYDRYFLTELGYQLCRVDFSLENEEVVSEDTFLVQLDENHGLIFAQRTLEGDEVDSLVALDLNSLEETVVFDSSDLDWTFEELDKVTYSDLDYDGTTVTATVSQFGYREGESVGWRDVLVESMEISAPL